MVGAWEIDDVNCDTRHSGDSSSNSGGSGSGSGILLIGVDNREKGWKRR